MLTPYDALWCLDVDNHLADLGVLPLAVSWGIKLFFRQKGTYSTCECIASLLSCQFAHTRLSPDRYVVPPGGFVDVVAVLPDRRYIDENQWIR